MEHEVAGGMGVVGYMRKEGGGGRGWHGMRLWWRV